MFLNAFQTQHQGDRVYFGSEFEGIIHHHGGEGMVSRQALTVVLGVRQVIILNFQSEIREMNARTQFLTVLSLLFNLEPRPWMTTPTFRVDFSSMLNLPRYLRTERARSVSSSWIKIQPNSPQWSYYNRPTLMSHFKFIICNCSISKEGHIHRYQKLGHVYWISCSVLTVNLIKPRFTWGWSLNLRIMYMGCGYVYWVFFWLLIGVGGFSVAI